MGAFVNAVSTQPILGVFVNVWSVIGLNLFPLQWCSISSVTRWGTSSCGPTCCVTSLTSPGVSTLNKPYEQLITKTVLANRNDTIRKTE